MHTPPPNMYAAVYLLACAIARLGFALYIRQQQRQDAAAKIQAAFRDFYGRKVDAKLAEMRKQAAIKLAELNAAYTEPDDFVVVGNATTEHDGEWVVIGL